MYSWLYIMYSSVMVRMSCILDNWLSHLIMEGLHNTFYLIRPVQNWPSVGSDYK